MRKASTLVGLILLLAGTARAEEAAPAASAAPAAAPRASEPAAAPAAPAADAKSEPVVVESSTVAPAAKPRKLQLGIAFLPMAAGKIIIAPSGNPVETDAAFAYGLGLSLDYFVFGGLSIGVAPQAALNVKAKSGGRLVAKQADILLRVAYTYPVVDNIRVYLEVLPGYSILITDDLGKGFALAAGAGIVSDLSDRAFVNIGAGYEWGWQKFSGRDDHTKYIRVALGGGVRF